jgi:hypothetical protein
MKITIYELRKLIKEELETNEGFKDRLKSFGKAALLATSLAGNASANPVSFGNSSTLTATQNRDTIVIKDSMGEEHEFYFVTEITLNGKKYCALEFVDAPDEENNIFYFEYATTKLGKKIFKEIKNKKTWLIVKMMIEKKLNIEDPGEIKPKGWSKETW